LSCAELEINTHQTKYESYLLNAFCKQLIQSWPLKGKYPSIKSLQVKSFEQDHSKGKIK